MRKQTGSIKIGGFDYAIFADDEVNIGGDRNVYGYCDTQNLEIVYYSRLKEEKAQQVILHEVLHAVMAHIGIQAEDEEEFVLSLGNQLHQVLADEGFAFKIGTFD